MCPSVTQIEFVDKSTSVHKNLTPQKHGRILTIKEIRILLANIKTMSKESKTSLRGRDAKTGEFTTVDKARHHKNTHVVERIPKPGYGDTK